MTDSDKAIFRPSQIYWTGGLAWHLEPMEFMSTPLGHAEVLKGIKRVGIEQADAIGLPFVEEEERHPGGEYNEFFRYQVVVGIALCTLGMTAFEQCDRIFGETLTNKKSFDAMYPLKDRKFWAEQHFSKFE